MAMDNTENTNALLNEAEDLKQLTYNKKSRLMEKFITYVMKKRVYLGDASGRQSLIVYHFIEILQLAQKDLSISSAQFLTNAVKECVGCDCDEEIECVDYQDFFSLLDDKLRELDVEQKKENRKLRKKKVTIEDMNDPVFVRTKFHYICNRSKPYWDMTVKLGYMDEFYMWRDDVTRGEKAVWVSSFSHKFEKGKPLWKWAEDLWGEKDLCKAHSYSMSKVNRERFDEIEQIFQKNLQISSFF